MIIRFKKLHEDAVLPTYAKPGDACMDLTAVTYGIMEKRSVQFNLGFSMEIPEGHVGLIFPRSSITNTDLMLKNSVGVIDSGYRGEVVARFKQDANVLPQYYKQYHKGDRIAPLMILPYPIIKTEWTDELSDTERGEGGFGHTGA